MISKKRGLYLWSINRSWFSSSLLSKRPGITQASMVVTSLIAILGLLFINSAKNMLTKDYLLRNSLELGYGRDRAIVGCLSSCSAIQLSLRKSFVHTSGKKWFTAEGIAAGCLFS